ncbi:unnamed protein product [Diamesa hyperborea]
MALQGLLSHFTGNEEAKSVDRIFPGFNPFGHQQRYQTYGHPYQFPHGVTHEHVFPDENHDFSLKFGQGDGGGGGAPYGPPPEMKKGKVKGAALSALTLLAFLFFLNLLQSCLKDHMDAMNPTVMVMTGGLGKSNPGVEEQKSIDEPSDEAVYDDEDGADYHMELDDYDTQTEQAKPLQKNRVRKLNKNKIRMKSKQGSTIAPKLHNLLNLASSMFAHNHK